MDSSLRMRSLTKCSLSARRPNVNGEEHRPVGQEQGEAVAVQQTLGMYPNQQLGVYPNQELKDSSTDPKPA